MELQDMARYSHGIEQDMNARKLFVADYKFPCTPFDRTIHNDSEAGTDAHRKLASAHICEYSEESESHKRFALMSYHSNTI